MCIDFYYPSCGKGMIHARRWEPAGKPRGVLQIVHGILEHVGRYDDYARFMAEQGFVVVAEDHMGHGQSIGEEGTKGYFDGGWFRAVADTHHLMKTTMESYPDVPYYLLGHSMGSFMVRTMLIKYPGSGISGAILCGTAWMHRAMINTGHASAALICKTQGERVPSHTLQAVAFGSYNNRIEHKRTEFDWLSRNSKVVDSYVADPLCGFTGSAGIFRDMMKGLRFIQEPENLKKMQKDLPVLFIAGSADPVGDYGAGVEKAVKAFEKAGMERVSLRLYPLCRHALLSELNKEDVYRHILQWIDCKPNL